MANSPAVLRMRSGLAPAVMRDASHAFYLGIGAAAVVTVFTGFAPSFFLPPWRGASHLAPVVIAHATAFSSWIALFFIQTALVASGRTGLHRRLGVATTLLAAMMIATAIPLALSAAGRGALPGDPLAFLLVVLVDLVCFGSFVGAAIHYRHQGETHKRLMVLAVTSLMPPAVSRWPIAIQYPVVIGVVVPLFLAVAPVVDLWEGRRQSPISLWGGLALLASIPLRLAIARTEPWHRLAGWLIRLTTPYATH